MSLSDARSLDTQPSALGQPDKSADADGEGDDYIDDYTGVNEESIGIGANGRHVLEDIFGSGLSEGDETVRKDEKLTSRKDENVEEAPPSEPSSADSPLNVDVEGTIERVEKILAQNPDLPRLSRGEILEIYRNITSGNNTLASQSQDSTVGSPQTTTSPNAVKPRDENKKSLLVVLPFNANDMKDSNIEDLYTKRPVTQMIGAEFEIPVKVTPHRATAANDISYEHNSNKVNPSPVYKPPTDALYSTGNTVVRPTTNHYRQTINNYNRTKLYHTSTTKPVYTSTTRQTSTPGQKHKNYVQTSSPGQRFNNYENNVIDKNRETSSTQRPSLVQYEISKRKKPQPVDAPQESHKTRPAIAQYQDVNPFRPMPPPPKLTAANEDYRPSTQTSNEVTASRFQPVTIAKPRKTTPQPPVATNYVDAVTYKPAVRNDIQTVLASLGLYPDGSGQHVRLDATTTTTSAKPPLTADMQNVLESLGLLPAASNVQQVVHGEAEEPGFVPSPDVGSYAGFKPLPTGESTAGDKDVSGELKQILASFGLVPGSDLGQGTLDFDSLGQIDVSGRRGQKAMPASAKPNEVHREENKMAAVNADGMSDEMRGVLENLGLLTTATTSTTERGEGHIFNPVSHAASLNHTQAQFEKLSQLISTIQLLAKDNETFTQAEIDELNAAFNLAPIMEDSVEDKREDASNPLDQLLEGPDPLTTDELIDLYIKNEVKRQQPGNETSTEAESILVVTPEAASTTPQTTTTTTETTSTTEDSEERAPALTDFTLGADEGAASIADLEDSFGGGAEAADQTEALTKKPNGLYFLVDWNSFLEVGEEGKNKTTIRFQPRVGNAKNFIAVTVP